MAFADYLPQDIRERYEIHDYRHAAAILSSEFNEEFQEIITALREFRLTEKDITDPGKNKSQIPKNISLVLDPLGWAERTLEAKMMADGDIINPQTHKIDYVKGRVAFDLEWNSKDQTYDRDLYAFRTFFDFNRISVAVLLTRSNQLDPLFKRLDVFSKYGASTTQMGKLLPRLDAGRNGGCPVLVFGITPRAVDVAIVIPSDLVQPETPESPRGPIITDDIANVIATTPPEENTE